MEPMNNTTQAMRRSKEWLPLGWKLMVAYGIFFIVLSILIPLHSYFSLPGQPMMTFAVGDERFTGLSWSQIMSISPNLGLWIVFTMISMCGMMMGSGILILAIARRPYRQGERWAWRALLAATLVPFAHYTFISTVHWSHGIPLWTLLPGKSGVGADLINIIALVWLYFGLWLPRKELQD
jgi:hypothetical protein